MACAAYAGDPEVFELLSNQGGSRKYSNTIDMFINTLINVIQHSLVKLYTYLSINHDWIDLHCDPEKCLHST